MDKTVHGGHAPGFFHFRVGSVRTADAYIIRHGAAEQNGILGNQRYVGKKILFTHLPHVDAVHLHAAGKDIIKTAQQINERRLPCSAGPNQGHHLSGRNAEINVPHDGRVLLITEANVAELHFPLPCLRAFWIFRFGHVIRSIQHVVDAFQTGIKGFRLVMDSPQLLDRLIAKIHGRGQRGKIPHVHAVHVANQQGGGHGYGADELNQGGQQALPPDRADRRLDITADPVPEQPYLLLFQFKGPDIPLGREILLERGGKIPLAGLHHPGAGKHFFADVPDGNHANAYQKHIRQQNKKLLADGGPVNQKP